jgi:hypothetical protein
MSLTTVLGILSALADRLEDLTIERDAVADILVKAGFTRGDVEQIWTDAKSDSATRAKARLALADLRAQLEAHGTAAGRAAPPGKPSKPEQPN